MALQDEIKKWRNYYHQAWSPIAEDFKSLLLDNGFSLKGCVIGKKQGEAYAYAVEVNDTEHPFYLLMIAPTATGKAKIKLVFNDKKELRVVSERIKAELGAIQFGKVETTKEGRFAVEYLFIDTIPAAKPEEAGELLLERASLWLKTITAT